LLNLVIGEISVDGCSSQLINDCRNLKERLWLLHLALYRRQEFLLPPHSARTAGLRRRCLPIIECSRPAQMLTGAPARAPRPDFDGQTAKAIDDLLEAVRGRHEVIRDRHMRDAFDEQESHPGSTIGVCLIDARWTIPWDRDPEISGDREKVRRLGSRIERGNHHQIGALRLMQRTIHTHEQHREPLACIPAK